MGQIDQVLVYAQSIPWAIEPQYGQVVAAILQRRAAGEQLTAGEIRSAVGPGKERQAAHLAAADRMTRSTGGLIAVIPFVGVVTQRAGMFGDSSGMVSTEGLVRRLRAAAADPDVGAIVLDVDSPGGGMPGVPEAADAIAAIDKPVVAVANSLMASAAYYLASQAHEVVVSPSSLTGSIGVMALHLDWSGAFEQAGIKPTLVKAGRYKTEGNSYMPLSEEAQQHMQALIDETYGEFVGAVARARGVKPADVRKGFGEGRVVSAKEAVRLGMADRVDTLQGVVERLARGKYPKRRGAQAEAVAPVAADVDAAEDVADDVLVEPAAANAPEPAIELRDDLDLRRRQLDLQ
jgi:signal peptide peptidase SppA